MQRSGRSPAATDGFGLVAHYLETADLGPPQHIPKIIDLALDDYGPVAAARG